MALSSNWMALQKTKLGFSGGRSCCTDFHCGNGLRDGTRSALARCSIVNFHGAVLYDKFVRPVETVVDYRTHVSGIRPADIADANPHAVEFKQCQSEVAVILKDRVLVGHSIKHDLQCLLLSHPGHLIRDTARCKLLCPHKPRALRVLLQERLSIDVQTGSHDSVEDARAVLALYKLVRMDWEKTIATRHRVIKSKQAREARKQAVRDGVDPPSESKQSQQSQQTPAADQSAPNSLFDFSNYGAAGGRGPARSWGQVADAPPSAPPADPSSAAKDSAKEGKAAPGKASTKRLYSAAAAPATSVVSDEKPRAASKKASKTAAKVADSSASPPVSKRRKL